MAKMKENEYQQEVIKKIYARFPDDEPFVDILVYINDPNYVQGILDLSIFRRDKWAMLEVKAEEKSKVRPNQRWYVHNWGRYVFTAFIYPENETEVLDALEQALRS